MKSHLLLAVMAVGALAPGVHDAYGAVEYSTVFVRVVDGSNNPISGASVTVKVKRGSRWKTLGKGVTGENGKAVKFKLKPYKYVLVVDAGEAYEKTSTPLTVYAGATSTATVIVRPKDK